MILYMCDYFEIYGIFSYTMQIRDDYHVGKAHYSSPAPSSKRKHGDRLSRLIEAGLRSKTEQGLTEALERLPFSDANVNLKDDPESKILSCVSSMSAFKAISANCP